MGILEDPRIFFAMEIFLQKFHKKGQKSAALSWKICKKHIKNILKKVKICINLKNSLF